MVELRYAEARGTLSEEKWSLKRGKELAWLGVEVGQGRGRGGRFWADSLARAKALGRNGPEAARNERGEREQRRKKGRRRQDHPWDPTVTKESSSEPCVPIVTWVPS